MILDYLKVNKNESTEIKFGTCNSIVTINDNYIQAPLFMKDGE